jgi:serine/threonine-protein kinase
MAAELLTLPTEPSALLAEAPKLIGRFATLGEIGRGSNGVVYSAHDPVLNREVAIKAIPLTTDSYFRQQIEANFLNEAKAAGGLNHPHIVTVFDAGKTDTLAYIAMERLHGRDLHDVIASGERLQWRAIAQLMARVADAVHYAHKRGLIHRDIKPSNIFIGRDGKPKVLDFGVAVATMAGSDATHRRQLIGTPNYMSPEQAIGRRLDARSDVFSLGTILYELLAGRRAFEGKDVEDTLAQVVTETPAPIEELRPDAPKELIAIANRSLAKNVDERYQTAGEMRNDLAAFTGSRPGSTRRHNVTRSPVAELAGGLLERWTWTHSALAAATCIALMVLAWMLVFPGGTDMQAERRGTDAPPAATAAAPAGGNPNGATSAGTTVPAPANGQASAPGAATPAPGTASPAAGNGGDAAAQPAPAPRAPSEVRRTRVDTAAVKAAAQASGFINLAIAPWGEVIVDGVSQGVSPPLTRLTLSPGVHVIELRNGAAPPLSARVEVRPGQTLSLQHRF